MYTLFIFLQLSANIASSLIINSVLVWDYFSCELTDLVD